MTRLPRAVASPDCSPSRAILTEHATITSAVAMRSAVVGGPRRQTEQWHRGDHGRDARRRLMSRGASLTVAFHPTSVSDEEATYFGIALIASR